MARDDQHGAPDLDAEDDGGESHAADEPTAVWDESALRAAGLGDLWRKRDAEPAPKPATPGVGPAAAAPSIVVEDALAAPPVAAAPPAAETPVKIKTPLAPAPAAARKGLGWGATVGIALGLGALMYALIRLLKG